MKEIAITISKTNSMAPQIHKSNLFKENKQAQLPESELAQPKEIIKVLNQEKKPEIKAKSINQQQNNFKHIRHEMENINERLKESVVKMVIDALPVVDVARFDAAEEEKGIFYEEEKLGDKSGELPDFNPYKMEPVDLGKNEVEYGEYQIFGEKKMVTLKLHSKMTQPIEAEMALRNSGFFSRTIRSIVSNTHAAEDPVIEFPRGIDSQMTEIYTEVVRRVESEVEVNLKWTLRNARFNIAWPEGL